MFCETCNISNKLSFLNKYLVSDGCFIAGGCFKDILRGKKPRDIDIYFYDKYQYDKCLKIFTSKKFEKVYENCNALCLLDVSNNTKIELIKKVFGTPKEVMETNFDFTICKFAYYKKNKWFMLSYYSVMYHEDFYTHLENRRIHIDGNIKYKKGCIKRIFKYIGYGFIPDFYSVKKAIFCKSTEDDSMYNEEEVAPFEEIFPF